MSARILITGASGGIGSAAMTELRSRGASVVGLDLEADEAAGVLACDLRDPDTLTNRAVRRMVKRGGFSERGIAAELSARLSAR
jgi:nucleoside-diphosphate-sugar epimerase